LQHFTQSLRDCKKSGVIILEIFVPIFWRKFYAEIDAFNLKKSPIFQRKSVKSPKLEIITLTLGFFGFGRH
jgi:hypothetical protein